MLDVRDISSEVDLKLSLLSGEPMCSSLLVVEPLTIREIKDIGFSKYNKLISLIAANKKDITNDDPKFDGISLFEFVINSGNEELIGSYLEAIAFFLKRSISDLDVNEFGLIFEGRDFSFDIEKCTKIVNKDNFEDFVQIIKYQNCLSSPSEKYDKPTPANEKSRRILEKINKGKEIVSKIKSKTKSDIDFADIVSAVSTKSNTYNKQNIWDLTIYQLYDEYKRLEAISGYDFGIMAMLQGAKIDDMKHWSSKID